MWPFQNKQNQKVTTQKKSVLKPITLIRTDVEMGIYYFKKQHWNKSEGHLKKGDV